MNFVEASGERQHAAQREDHETYRFLQLAIGPSWPHEADPTIRKGQGVDGISFTVHPRTVNGTLSVPPLHLRLVRRRHLAVAALPSFLARRECEAPSPSDALKP